MDLASNPSQRWVAKRPRHFATICCPIPTRSEMWVCLHPLPPARCVSAGLGPQKGNYGAVTAHEPNISARPSDCAVGGSLTIAPPVEAPASKAAVRLSMVTFTGSLSS